MIIRLINVNLFDREMINAIFKCKVERDVSRRVESLARIQVEISQLEMVNHPTQSLCFGPTLSLTEQLLRNRPSAIRNNIVISTWNRFHVLPE